ncbi:TPA: hypothetical protein RQL08_003268 [Vibrio vulnificus]|nr:hypothetical protein [Vibrio vulnificus]HDY8136886.1 hypothetical protein [Vibrio vulnificus]HDY8150409.1 hypothetical protein [Vibrio vulnificus]HDY8153858.1 hypothetical protein [Vibrio vulnificus]
MNLNSPKKENHLFLVRNLLSLKASNAIKELEGIGNYLDLYLGDFDANFKTLRNNAIDKRKLTCFKSFKYKGSLLNYFLDILAYKKDVRKFLLDKKVTNVYITNPIHLNSSVFYSEAKKLNIKIAFFEEGICFYRGLESEQYKKRSLKNKFKRWLHNLYGIYQGYDKEPDTWYSSLDFYQESKKIKLKYNIVESARDINYLFLSRPASDDFSGISISDEIKAIKAFYREVVVDENLLFIKFHPRENTCKREKIISGLKKERVNVEELKCQESSEDVVYSMKSGCVAGYETTTLVYCESINSKINVYSVADFVAEKDISRTISDFIVFYKKNFNHIKYIKDIK